jgi:hypothetical protein
MAEFTFMSSPMRLLPVRGIADPPTFLEVVITMV